MFVAKHHVTLGGRHYLPGEVIEKEVPADTAKWWLSVDAVEKIMDVPSRAIAPPPPPNVPDDTDDQKDVPDNTGNQEGEQVDSDKQEDVPDDSDEQEDEIDEAAEPEEIDVSAGIVPSAPEPPKPERTSRKRGGNKS